MIEHLSHMKYSYFIASRNLILLSAETVRLCHFSLLLICHDFLSRQKSPKTKKRGCQLFDFQILNNLSLSPIVTNYRTFVDDMYKVLEFAEWVKEMGDFALFA